jgi:hypothetical protein
MNNYKSKEIETDLDTGKLLIIQRLEETYSQP